MQEKLREALQACIDSGLGSHDHWDETMQHGKGCLRCIKQREARELARAALAASEPAPQPDFHKLTEDIFNLLGKWNDTFLAGRDALESKLHEWIGSGPAVVKYDTCCDQAGTVHSHAVAAVLDKKQ